MQRLLIMAVLALLLAACNRPAPADAPKPPETDAPAAVETVEATGTITITPASYSACPREKGAKGDIGTVNWDASDAGVAAISVAIITRDGVEGTFARGKPVGSKQTGPWMVPGVTLVLRDRDTSRELARVVAGSVPCESGD